MLKKCNVNLYLLLRIKSFLDIHSRKNFFNAYILPHLDYCCTIWGNCGDELQNRVLKFQKRAARIILEKDLSVPSKELFKELRWMPFSERINYKKAILVYKALNNICPEYLTSKFSPVQQLNTNHQLRSFNNKELAVPKPRIEFFRKSLYYSGPIIWNEIPISIRSIESLAAFKNAYLKWRFSVML